MDTRDDPRLATSHEIALSHSLRNNKLGLSMYWDNLFVDQNLTLLESVTEIGRTGIISEIISRNASPGVVLDVGCGTGILSSMIDIVSFTYLGCDISTVAINFAIQHRARDNVSFVTSTFQDLGHIDSVSAIVFNESLYYLDVEEALTNASKLLSPSGLLIISIFDFPEGRLLLDSLRDRLSLIVNTSVSNLTTGFRWDVVAGHL